MRPRAHASHSQIRRTRAHVSNTSATPDTPGQRTRRTLCADRLDSGSRGPAACPRTCLCPYGRVSVLPRTCLCTHPCPWVSAYLCPWYLSLRLTWGVQVANCCCSWLRKGRSLAQDQLLGPLHSLMLLLLSRRTQPEQPQRQFS